MKKRRRTTAEVSRQQKQSEIRTRARTAEIDNNEKDWEARTRRMFNELRRRNLEHRRRTNATPRHETEGSGPSSPTVPSSPSATSMASGSIRSPRSLIIAEEEEMENIDPNVTWATNIANEIGQEQGEADKIIA